VIGHLLCCDGQILLLCLLPKSFAEWIQRQNITRASGDVFVSFPLVFKYIVCEQLDFLKSSLLEGCFTHLKANGPQVPAQTPWVALHVCPGWEPEAGVLEGTAGAVLLTPGFQAATCHSQTALSPPAGSPLVVLGELYVLSPFYLLSWAWDSLVGLFILLKCSLSKSPWTCWEKCLVRNEHSWVLVAHTCNSSYSGGRNQKDHGSKPTRANSSWDPISKIPITKVGWHCESRCRPWVQTPLLHTHRKKEMRISHHGI
jgi:hypothetical protein